MSEISERTEAYSDYFGNCPVCHQSNGMISIERQHWGHCQTHQTKWRVGENLFSAWKEQSELENKANEEFLANYCEVEAVLPNVSALSTQDSDEGGFSF